MSIRNRRTSPRHRTSLNGHLVAHGHRISVQIENLSLGGARISLDKPLMEGDEVELRFSPTQAAALSGEEQLCAPGTVMWFREDMEAGFQAGIKFEPLQPSIKDLLDSLLESYPPA